MPFAKFQFKAGIDREGTDYTNAGGWFDGSLIRFRKGFVEKVGGWSKNTANTFLGTCRKLFPWISLEGTKYLFTGTHLKTYVKDGNSFYDVTPIRSTTSAGDVTFGAVDGDATITVSDTAHGAVQNDFVTFSGAVSLGGNITATVLNQEYQIATIVDADSYTIEAKDTDGATVTANSSDTGNGGASVVGAYQINVGLDDYVQSTGYGVGAWGAGPYGSATSLSATNQLRLWFADNFGEDLIFNPRGGGIYYWDESSGTSTRAVDITTLSGANLAPTVGLQTIVSETDRHVFVLGADPINQPYEIFVGEEDNQSDYKYYNNKGEYKRYRIEHKFPMVPNNALIFQGMEKIHWRETCNHDHFITVFLHYVDQEGPYKEYKFDKRSCLGEEYK